MSENIRQFKNYYKKLKRMLLLIETGDLTSDKIAAIDGKRYKSMDDFVVELKKEIRNCEASVKMFCNLNGTVNKNVFYKFYDKFITANPDEKSLYEEANGGKYGDLLEYLQKTKNKLDEAEKKKNEDLGAQIDALLTRIDKRKKLKQELVELGIAVDDGDPSNIVVKPERFADYLKYLEKHSVIEI